MRQYNTDSTPSHNRSIFLEFGFTLHVSEHICCLAASDLFAVLEFADDASSAKASCLSLVMLSLRSMSSQRPGASVNDNQLPYNVMRILVSHLSNGSQSKSLYLNCRIAKKGKFTRVIEANNKAVEIRRFCGKRGTRYFLYSLFVSPFLLACR